MSCTSATTADGSEITFSAPKDVTSDFDAEEAVEIDFQGTGIQGQIFALRQSEGIAVFQFQNKSSADTSQLPDPATIVKKGIDKLAG